MSIVRSLLLLGTVACAVLGPIFLGHALAVHAVTPAVLALVFVAIAIVLGALQLRAGRGAADAPAGRGD